MSKVVLIMDKPETCLDCRFCREINEGVDACCEMTDEPGDSSLCRMIEDYCQCRPSWCPLKEHKVYDIDKVVEELEELQEKALRVNNYDVSFYAAGMMQKAIEIVKQGSTSNDVCEWKWEQLYGQWNGNPQCKGDTVLFDSIRLFTYCPYCGKKIKVVE